MATYAIMISEQSNLPGGKIKVAVIGTGSLGKEHARIYAELAAAGAVEFSGVYDVSMEAARKHAEKHGVKVFKSVEEAAQMCHALSVVTPTVTHYEIAHDLLKAG